MAAGSCYRACCERHMHATLTATAGVGLTFKWCARFAAKLCHSCCQVAIAQPWCRRAAPHSCSKNKAWQDNMQGLSRMSNIGALASCSPLQAYEAWMQHIINNNLFANTHLQSSILSVHLSSATLRLIKSYSMPLCNPVAAMHTVQPACCSPS